jgi:competence protein ComEC
MSEPAPEKHFRSMLARRPALPAVIALILGIVSYRTIPPHPVMWITLAGVFTLVSVAVLRRMGSAVAILVAIFFCGLASAQLREFYFPQNHIGQYTPEDPRLVRLELRIAETPRIFADSFTHLHHSAEHQSVRAEALRIETPEGWRHCSGAVALHLSYPLDALAAGQVVRALGYLERPPPAMNPGQFDWSERRREERGLATLVVPHPQHVTILSSDAPGLLSRLRDTTRAALARGFGDARSLDHLMLRALLLGDSDIELREVRAAFQHTGTAHLLAISGLHVVIVWAFIYNLCRLLRLRPSFTIWVTGAFVILYGLSALPSTPAERAVLLCLAATFSLVLQRRVDSIQLLSTICFAMLIVDPLSIFEPGFQLSFACVLGLMTLQGRMAGQIRRMRDRDVEIAHTFRPATGMTAALRWLRAHTEQAVAGAIVAWAISIPIVETHFNQLNVWSIPCAILLAPLTFASIVAGLLKIVLTLALPWLAGIWAIGASGPIRLLRVSAEFLAKIPGSDFPLRAPSPWIVALYFAALTLAIAPIAWPRVKRATLGASIILLVTLATFPFMLGASPGAVLKITVLCVGNGRCIVIEAPSADPVMIDAGSARVSQLQYSVIAPFLRSEGISNIGWLFLGDGDYDDINACAEVAGEFSPRRIFISPHLRNRAQESYVTNHLMQELDAMGLSPQAIAQGQMLAVDRGDTELEVLWPPANCAMGMHDCGLVLKLTYAGKTIVFPANIDVAAEKELLKHPQNLKADVLIAPHHGTTNAATAEFIAAVNPSVVISSNAMRMTEKQKELESIVEPRKLYRTDSSGAITVTIDRAGKITVTPFLK